MTVVELAAHGSALAARNRAAIEGLSMADLQCGSEVPLGKYTNFGATAHDQQLAQLFKSRATEVVHPGEGASPEVQRSYRLGRAYGALFHARQLLASYGMYGRVASCGTRLVNRVKGVDVYARPDRVFGRVGGICMCGSSMCCPVCAPRIAGKRVGEIEQAAIRARHEGSRVFMVTLTAPHREGSNLHEEILTWRRMFELATRGRPGRAIREHRRGFINAAEVTRSIRAGWHFHRHLLVFSKNHVEPDFAGWRDNWRHASHVYGRYSDGWEEHAFDAKEIFDSEDYVSKIGCELGSPLTKAARSILWLLLADYEMPGRWGPDYVEATWALQLANVGAVRWSRGLADSLGIEREKTDQEAAEEMTTDTDVLLGRLSAGQWERVVAWNLEAQLVQVAQDGRTSLDDFLVENGIGPLDSDFPNPEVSNEQIQ